MTASSAIAVIRRLLVLAVAALAAASLLPGSAQAQTVRRYTNTLDSAANGINDTATSCSNPLTRTFAVSTAFTVSAVQIGVLAAHTYRGDLRMSLVSPAGTRVELTPGSNTNGNNNFNALFDDSATSGIAAYTGNDQATATTAVPPYNSTFRPSVALSTFAGTPASGTWTLEICDQYATDTGTFYQADLYLTEGSSAGSANLSLTQTVSTATPTSGSAVTFTLTVSNAATSSVTASGVQVTDLLPSGLVFNSFSGAGTYDSATGIWAVPTIAPGTSRALSLVANVSASTGAPLVNTAEITAAGQPDPNSTPGNGISTEDDYASRSLTVSGTRSMGVAPALSCPKTVLLFDWDPRAWTAGSTSNAYALTGLGSVQFNLATAATWMTDATFGGTSPTLTNVLTGGVSPAQRSLAEYIDFANRTQVATTVITLPVPVPGAQFRVYDVDFNSGQFADRLKVTGTYNGATVLPVLTNGTANYVIGNQAYGDILSANGAADGNVTVTFSAPVDTITLEYGNHSTAPTNPGGQAIAISDITLCSPDATLAVTKASTVLDDPTNGTTNPVAIPGANVSYCITIRNNGSAPASNIVASDVIPAGTAFVPGTMRSGAACATATTLEDDNATGTDDTDAIGASASGSTLTIRAPTLAAGSAIALTYTALVQ